MLPLLLPASRALPLTKENVVSNLVSFYPLEIRILKLEDLPDLLIFPCFLSVCLNALKFLLLKYCPRETSSVNNLDKFVTEKTAVHSLKTRIYFNQIFFFFCN